MACTDDRSGQGVFHFLDGSDLLSDLSGHADPGSEADRQQHRRDRVSEDHQDQNDIQQRRHTVQNIHDSHHDHVGLPADVSGNASVEDADDQTDKRT